MALFGPRGSGESSTPSVEMWGLQGRHNSNVVGESHYEREIRAHLPGLAVGRDGGVVVPVRVVHDPNNKYDKNAVEIRSEHGVLGFLAREDAERYAPYLARVQSTGLTASTHARIWGRIDEGWDGARPKFWGQVRIELPEPHLLFPMNVLPPGSRMLPLGGVIQVTGEDKHLDALLPFVSDEGKCWVHAVVVELDGSDPVKRVLEVRIDGARVGQLTPKMSMELLPVVDFLKSRNESTCVSAVVTGSRLKAEVTLHVKRAHEIPAAWFDSLESALARPNAEPAKGDASDPLQAVTSTPLPPADWYPDPHGLARLRFWDGQGWTGHVAD